MTKFFDIVYDTFMSFCKLCFIGMVVVTAYVVFGRYVLKSSPVWGEPVVLMFMVYMSLTSAALAIRKGTHIRMSIIDLVISEKSVDRLNGLGHVCIFAFSLFMMFYGWNFAMVAGRNIMTGVGIRSVWLYLSVPFAGVALALMEIEHFLNYFIKLKNKREVE